MTDRESAAATAEDRACDVTVVETERRLSRSLLWALQRRYFEREGVEAWRTGTVPHYVTNNPALAHAYAAVALGFLRDLRAGGPLETAEPVTILELGAGSGRFAYLFLVALRRLLRASSLEGLRVRYVLTDFTAKNVDFCRAHEAFRPFVDEGLLDFAVFDAEHDGEVRLLGAGTTLGPGSLRSPPMVIANYVFDGIPQDAFAFHGGALHECLVTLRGPGSAADLDDPDRIGQLAVEYSRREASFDYYADPELDDLLREYASSLDGATLLFPFTAMQCMRRLAALAGGRLLLLSGDRGVVREDDLRDLGQPDMAIHGCFSMPVNYHAMVAYARRRGGQALTSPHRHAHLSVSAFLLGEHPSRYVETRGAYHEVFERGGPDELFSLRRGLQERYGELGLEPLVALLRVTHHDPRILRDCLPALWERLGEATGAARTDLVKLVGQVWENYYHLGEDRDIAFEFAMLLHALGEHAGALGLFEASLRHYGDDPRTRWNMGLCHAGAGQVDEAARCFAAATATGFVPSGALQAKESGG